jgi:hypothetical protein
MNGIIELIKTITALLWAILPFFLMWRFWPELPKLLPRLKRAKFLGQEIELKEELIQLNQVATAAESELRSLPPVAASVHVTGEVRPTVRSSQR